MKTTGKAGISAAVLKNIALLTMTIDHVTAFLVKDYLNSIGLDSIEHHEQTLRAYAEERLCSISGLRMFGTATKKDAVFSFLIDNIHHLDMGTLLDQLGIAVRTGHHCAEPLMQRLGVSGVVRASLAFYNTAEEIDRLAEGIQRIRRMF